MVTLVALKSQRLDLLKYSVKLLVDRIAYKIYFCISEIQKAYLY